jgi:hypothetical protein
MNLSSRISRHARLRKRATFRLEVERLEQRWVPSTVLNLNDSGAGSLRQAILDAPAGGTVDFQSGLTGTIVLTSGELAIGKDLTIDGPGAGVITVSGNNASRVFDITGSIVVITGLTVTHGSATAGDGNIDTGGGGIFIAQQSQVTITDCMITANAAGIGGGIDAIGSLSIARSTISGNMGGNFGGGIFDGGPETSTLTVTDSTFSGNSATSGGAVCVYGSAAYNGYALFVNCTFTGNSATNGGAIYGLGATGLINSTLSGNTASAAGGGAYMLFQAVNTIIAGNHAPSAPDVSGGIGEDHGNNLIGDGSGGSGFVASDLVGTAAQPINPKLGPLQDNGGPTQTMALLSGSPAIDAGNNAATPGFYDQRGPGYPRIVNGTIDIGAFESHILAVQNSNDSGPGSLRQAILDANAGSDSNTISFLPGVTGTINLASALPVLSSNIDLEGPGALLLTVQPGSEHSFRDFTVGSGAIVTLAGLTIANGGDTTGGGILNNGGTLTVSACTITGNTGGGIDNAGGTLTANNSTIAGNTGSSGGGIINAATLTLINSTIAGNTATGTGSGGGIDNTGKLTVSSSSLANNTAGGTGGGIFNGSNGTVTLRNTLIAQDQAATGPDVAGVFVSQGHNLITDGGGGSGFTATDLVGTSAKPIVPKLGPLQNNGGPTSTLALLAGSPAIDAGDSALPPGVYDQRGTGYRRIAGSAIDIGAFEFQTTPPTFFVLNTNDAGTGSLRQAILDANALPGDKIIAFAPGVTGTVKLASKLPDLNSNVDLEGPGPANLTVENNSPLSFNIFDVVNGAKVTISGMTVRQGVSNDNGTLAINNCGLANLGSSSAEDLSVSQCSVNGFGTGINIAASAVGTGGVITVDSCTFSDDGVGINLAAGSLTASNCSFHTNDVGISNSGTMTVNNCNIHSDLGRGISNSGTINVNNCTLQSSAGGLGNSGTAQVNSSTIAHNSASTGGGIYNTGTLSLTNSTVADNTAVGTFTVIMIPTMGGKFITMVETTPAVGGGIWNSGTLTATYCTIASNTATNPDGGSGDNGGGIAAITGGTVKLFDTILAQNQSATGPDGSGAFVSQGHNLIGNGSGATGFVGTDLVGTAANPISPRLGPLQNNGGPTQTMALLSGSPAINAGDPTNAPPWDQRGPGFPRVVNGTIDIGAFEGVQQQAVTGLVGRDPATGQWWVSRSTGSSFKTSVADVWSPSVTWLNVQTGDFTGNGSSDIIGMVKETGQWFVGVPDSQGHFTTRLWDAWNPSCTWTMAVGDVNGDGKDDIVGYAQQTGQWYVGISTGSAFTTALWDAWNPDMAWTNIMVGDVTGNGKADIMAYAPNSSQWWVGVSNGSAFHPSFWDVWNPSVTWVNVQLGDFNGDGRMDLVGRAQQYGQWWVGLSTGNSFHTTLWDAWSTGVTWADVLVGDFNGDGKADIIGRALQTGQWWTGLSTGAAFQASVWDVWSTGMAWVDVQVGDFNGDGRSDIVGMANQTGQWYVGLSKAQGGFSTSLWDGWNPAVAWSDVQTMKLG